MIQRSAIRELVERNVHELNCILEQGGCLSRVVFVWDETVENEDIIVGVILTTCAEAHGISVEKMRSKSRKRQCVEARFMAVFNLYKEFPKWSLTKVGSIVNMGDHSTVIHAKKTYSDLYETDRFFKRTADNVKQKINDSIERITSKDGVSNRDSEEQAFDNINVRAAGATYPSNPSGEGSGIARTQNANCSV